MAETLTGAGAKRRKEVDSDLTDLTDLTDQILEAIRHWSSRGDPMKSRDLYRHLNAGTVPPAELLNTTPIRPNKPGVDHTTLTVPPRVGQGGSIGVWRKFAREVSDMDPEVIDAMGREDLIAQLERMRIIPTETGE